MGLIQFYKLLLLFLLLTTNCVFKTSSDSANGPESPSMPPLQKEEEAAVKALLKRSKAEQQLYNSLSAHLCHDETIRCSNCSTTSCHVTEIAGICSLCAHLKSQRLLQFFMGLNESYDNSRSNILARKPVITVNEAYAIAAQEESQRTLGVVDKVREALALLGRRTQGYKPKKLGIACEICGYKGHPTEKCYRLIGYPANFKSKRKGKGEFKPGSGNFKPNAKHRPAAATHFTREADATNGGNISVNHFSEEQYNELHHITPNIYQRGI